MLFISVEDFLTQTSTILRLSRVEEKALAQRMETGDETARQALVYGYLPLAASFVRRAPREICTLHTVYACIAAVEKGVDSFSFLKLCIARKNLSNNVDIACDGSSSRIFSVLLISLGITILPKSSIRRIIPVDLIDKSGISYYLRDKGYLRAGYEASAKTPSLMVTGLWSFHKAAQTSARNPPR